jgi:hypothetical protein
LRRSSLLLAMPITLQMQNTGLGIKLNPSRTWLRNQGLDGIA